MNKTHKIYPSGMKHLQQALARHALRYETSALRFGLIPAGISDHIPIQATFSLSQHDGLLIHVVSWNLLSDEYLYYHFLNIAGLSLLRDQFQVDDGNVYCHQKENQLIHFFKALSRFFCRADLIHHGELYITPSLLKDFITFHRDQDPLFATYGQEAVEKSRADLIQFLISAMGLNDAVHTETASIYQLALRHGIEIIYHIEALQGDDQEIGGGLLWKKRKERLITNHVLLHALQKADFLCLQECTTPLDLLNLFDKAQYSQLFYKTRETSKDFCSIIYNRDKYQLVNQPMYFAIKGRKPCIMGVFQDQTTHTPFILGSIHHPGWKKNYVDELLKNVDILRTGMQKPTMPFYLFGDYNHTQPFFGEHDQYQFSFPEAGFMIGSNDGYIHQAIDGVCASTKLAVNRIEACRLSRSLEPLPFVIRFAGEEHKIKQSLGAYDISSTIYALSMCRDPLQESWSKLVGSVYKTRNVGCEIGCQQSLEYYVNILSTLGKTEAQWSQAIDLRQMVK